MSNMIEIKNLNKKFKLHQLKNINITLKKGEVLGIVGKNGAGYWSNIGNFIPSIIAIIYLIGLGQVLNNKEVRIYAGFIIFLFWGIMVWKALEGSLELGININGKFKIIIYMVISFFVIFVSLHSRNEVFQMISSYTILPSMLEFTGSFRGLLLTLIVLILAYIWTVHISYKIYVIKERKDG